MGYRVIATLLLVGACQKPHGLDLDQDLAKKLLRGRSVGHTPTRNYRTLNDAQRREDPALSDVLEIAYSEGSDAPHWLLLQSGRSPLAEDRGGASEALALIEAKSPLLGIGLGDLARPGAILQLSPTLKSIRFERLYRGLPVRDAEIQVILTRDLGDQWHVREILNQTHGRITVANWGDPAPSWSQVTDLLPGRTLTHLGSREVIFSVSESSGGENPETDNHVRRFFLATEFAARDDSGRRLTITVRHGSSEILEVFDDRYEAFPKTLTAKVYKSSYVDTTFQNKPLPLLPVSINGAAPQNTGAASVATFDSGSSLTLTLNSSIARVTRSALRADPRGALIGTPETAPTTVTLTAGPPSGDTIVLEPSATDLPALQVYTSLTEGHEFVRRHFATEEKAPGQAGYPLILQSGPATFFNVDGGGCNAFYTPMTRQIFLYRAGGPCGDTALIVDVARHEWGHGLDDSLNGITDGAFSEGIGDIVAVYASGRPEMSSGFFVNDRRPLRNSENNLVYSPTALTGMVHQDGQFIAGAFWRLRSELIAQNGKLRGAWAAERLFFRHLINTTTYLNSYTNVLALDDDDGNTATKSPNYCGINKAFARHGFATVDPLCNDPTQMPKPVLEWGQNNAIALLQAAEQEPTLNFLASSTDPGTESMGVCVIAAEGLTPSMPTTMETPELRKCVLRGEWTQHLTEGQKEEGVVIFKGRPLALSEKTRLILVSLDGSSRPITAREFRFEGIQEKGTNDKGPATNLPKSP